MNSFFDKARASLPEGTFAVGAGMLITAATTYGFVVIAARAVGNEVGQLSALWGLLFVAGPGLFLPLEQEVARALSHRKGQGLGGGPLIARAALAGGIALAGLSIIVLTTAPLLKDKLFDGNMELVFALLLGLVGYYGLHLSRGSLSGNARFGSYGAMLAAEGLTRLPIAIVCAIAGVKSPAVYGLILAISPFLAISIVMPRQRELITPGPPAPWSELSAALIWLLLGSVLMQLLGYTALLATVTLAEPLAGLEQSFSNAFFVARIPVLVFLAVQAALLPKLARLTGAGLHNDFRRGLRQLLSIVGSIAILGTLGAWLIGPEVGQLLFGKKNFSIGHTDLALLAAGSGAYIVALTIAQAVIALNGHRENAIGWLMGIVAFAVAIVLVDGYQTRIEIPYLIGSIVVALVMALLLQTRIRGHVQPSNTSIMEALESERPEF